MRSYAGVDGALERSCGGFVSNETEECGRVHEGCCGFLAKAQATARVDVPTAPREFSVFCSLKQFHGPS